MSVPTLVDDLVFAIESKRNEFDQVIGKLSESQCQHENVIGRWSVKDVLAHLSWYDQQMEWMVTRHSMDIPEVEIWDLPTDDRNEIIYQMYKDLPLAEVKAIAQARYERMLAAIKQLEESDLTDPSRYAGMDAEWVPADILSQNTWLHYADHLVLIRKEFGI
ncbi:MAG: ClbS/DfsB family four-helix bundle protein [Anaerolineae bacterium]|jgi:hypothetical protein|nr:ClbS/DfsB family four-helix bundle protein [Anaerolineae bacterium]